MVQPSVAIDGVNAPGVSGIDVTFEDAASQTTGEGGEGTTTRTKGARIRVTWGTDGTPETTRAMLVGLRDDRIAHTLAITDPNGTVHSFNVNWKAKVPLRLRLPATFDSITIEFTERP